MPFVPILTRLFDLILNSLFVCFPLDVPRLGWDIPFALKRLEIISSFLPIPLSSQRYPREIS
jgi:hypothetical protein